MKQKLLVSLLCVCAISAGSATPDVAPRRIPDTTVYDQNGRKLGFYSDLVKGKTVAINFIFTTCTTVCSPLTAKFREVQQALGDRVGGDIGLISISVDPTTDVPQRLASYAAEFHAGPGWSFVTGAKSDIDELLRTLGVLAGDKTSHTPMVLVGNDTAHFWTYTYGLASTTTLVSVVREAAAKRDQAVGTPSTAAARD
ncbi:MAG TPA: SCO family protein [Candidatus Solibacter sp.]|nr:SCO family protein [Candidatus Solibacter sp.]